jgi:hypothetical protein
MQRNVRFSFTTNGLGTATINIPIPGIFSSISRVPNTNNGRTVFRVSLFAGAPLAGDYVSNMTVQDTNGVIPALLQPQFPSYPIVASLADTSIPSGNAGTYLVTSGTTDFTPDPLSSFIPSQLFVMATFQKASAVVDTIFINVVWDDDTAS